MDARTAAVLELWLGPEAKRDDPAPSIRRRWFEKDPAFDTEIERTLGPELARAERGELDAWSATARGRVALVILFDQVTRNIRRGTGRCFDNDAKALALAKEGVELGVDRELRGAERQFLYMPFMHAESLPTQNRSVELFEALAKECPAFDSREWAERHRQVVKLFGRFPHRNAQIGRTSTGAEVEFLTKPGSSF